MSTIIAEYNFKEDARQAAQSLLEGGFERDRITLRSQPDVSGAPTRREKRGATLAGIVTGAIIGALVGAVAGFFLMAQPGDGAVITADPIPSFIGAMVVGAGFGAIGGAFLWNTMLKVSEAEDETELEDPIWEQCLVTVMVDSELMASRAKEILADSKAVYTEMIHNKPWRYTRWSHFTEVSHPEPHIEEEEEPFF